MEKLPKPVLENLLDMTEREIRDINESLKNPLQQLVGVDHLWQRRAKLKEEYQSYQAQLRAYR